MKNQAVRRPQLGRQFKSETNLHSMKPRDPNVRTTQRTLPESNLQVKITAKPARPEPPKFSSQGVPPKKRALKTSPVPLVISPPVPPPFAGTHKAMVKSTEVLQNSVRQNEDRRTMSVSMPVQRKASSDSSKDIPLMQPSLPLSRKKLLKKPLPPKPKSVPPPRPTAPARPAPYKAHSSLSSSESTSQSNEDQDVYDYVDPKRVLYTPSQKNVEAQLSEELDEHDLTRHYVMDDFPVSGKFAVE